MRARPVLALTLLVLMLVPAWPAAAASLDVAPLTWDVVGLDSNRPATDGPDVFPVGARVCNPSGETATGVRADLVWDSTSPYLTIQPGTSPTVQLGTVDPGGCADAYFNIQIVQRDSSAFSQTRGYHIDVSADNAASVSTPAGRQLYIEQLVSQNRNAVLGITGPDVVYTGKTYTFTLDAKTATNGYEQLEA